MTDPVIPPQAEAMMPKTASIDFAKPFDISSAKDRSVLITGSASGIGLACAIAMAEAGALVTIADIQRDAGLSAVSELASKGHRAQFVHCDVTKYEEQAAMFRKAVQFGHGKIDVVIPNAGIVAQKNLCDMASETEPSLNSPPPEPAMSGLEVNVKGVYYTCYLALHYFRLPRPQNDTFKKSIVLVSSLAGYVGYPSSTTYSISKYGVRGLFHSIRDKAASDDVRVNLIAPWYIDTPLTRTEEFLNSASGQALKFWGFAPMHILVDAVIRLSFNESIGGRAAAIFPDGNSDLDDNIWGGYGGVEIRRLMGDMFQKGFAKTAKMQAQ